MFKSITEFLTGIDFGWWILIALIFFILIFGPLAYRILRTQFKDMI